MVQCWAPVSVEEDFPVRPLVHALQLGVFVHIAFTRLPEEMLRTLLALESRRLLSLSAWSSLRPSFHDARALFAEVSFEPAPSGPREARRAPQHAPHALCAALADRAKGRETRLPSAPRRGRLRRPRRSSAMDRRTSNGRRISHTLQFSRRMESYVRRRPSRYHEP